MIEHAKKVEVGALDVQLALTEDEQAVFLNLLNKIDDHRTLMGRPSIAIADLECEQEVADAH